MVVCVKDDEPVGIDIKNIRPLDLKVAKHACTDEELIYLFGHTPTEQDFSYTTDQVLLTRFFKRWTKKEAFYEYIGVGIWGMMVTGIRMQCKLGTPYTV